MRQVTAGLVLGLALVATAGCTPNKRDGGVGGIANTRTSAPPPSTTALVSYLNDNAGRVQGIRCDRAAVDCNQDGNRIGVDGILLCQKPRNFRLRLKAVGQEAADLGSNNDEFWFWVSKNNPPYVFHCSYQDFAAKEVRLPFPFQPDMVLMALGMAEYNPKGQYTVNTPPGASYYELVEATQSAQGRPVQRVTVFNRNVVDPRNGTPQVIAYALRDDKGKTICQARVKEVAVTERGGIVSKNVTLKWPDLKTEMTIKLFGLRTLKPEEMTAEKQEKYYRRTDLTAPTYDLATGRLDRSGLQQASVPPR